MLVSCICRDTLAGVDIQDRKPDGDEELCFISVTELIIYIGQDLGGRTAHLRPVLDKGLGDHHEERCRNSLAADVCHDQSQMGIVDQEVVVEVSSHLLGRIHGCVDIELLVIRKCRVDPRKHVRLDLGSDI